MEYVADVADDSRPSATLSHYESISYIIVADVAEIIDKPFEMTFFML